MAPLSSSQELLLQLVPQLVPQPTQSFTLASLPPDLVPQPPTQPPHSSSWASSRGFFEVGTIGHSTPETVWRYGVPTVPPPRPQPSFFQPPPYDRPTSTKNYPCTDASPRGRLRSMAHEIYPVHSTPIQASQSPARFAVSSLHNSQLSSSKLRFYTASPHIKSQG